MIRCLELFAGAGGAALGLEAAGLTHAALCEWDRDACATLRADGPAPTVTTEWGHAQPWTKAGAGWMVQSGVCDSACETHGVARECTRPAPTVPVTSHLYLAAPSPTVSAIGEQKGSGRRRLTVAECALLQDFPADHPWQGGVGARYRQVGNAVPPRLAEVVGRALIEATK